MRNKSDSLPKSKKMLIAVICIVATIAITLFCIENGVYGAFRRRWVHITAIQKRMKQSAPL